MIYEDIRALNWSTLKEIAVSPAWMRHLLDHPEERGDKDSYRRGRAIHCALLEPDRFDTDYVVQPDFAQIARDRYGDLKTKAAQMYRDSLISEWTTNANPSATRISMEERDMALRSADAVRAHRPAAELLEGAKMEQAVQWFHPGTGLACKGRLDIVSDRVVDLKSTRRNTFSEVLRDAALFDYHVQVAWYHDGASLAKLIDGKTLPAAIFVHATPKSSFIDVAVIDMARTPWVLDSARATYERLINLYAGCLEADIWPGMCPGSEAWKIPEWKMEENLDD